MTPFLDEWWRQRGRWFEVVRVVGDERSARSHEIRDVLHRNALPLGSLETSPPGVFAVGDVRHGSIKRVASAVGEGSAAIRSVGPPLPGIDAEAAT